MSNISHNGVHKSPENSMSGFRTRFFCWGRGCNVYTCDYEHVRVYMSMYKYIYIYTVYIIFTYCTYTLDKEIGRYIDRYTQTIPFTCHSQSCDKTDFSHQLTPVSICQLSRTVLPVLSPCLLSCIVQSTYLQQSVPQ